MNLFINSGSILFPIAVYFILRSLFFKGINSLAKKYHSGERNRLIGVYAFDQS